MSTKTYHSWPAEDLAKKIEEFNYQWYALKKRKREGKTDLSDKHLEKILKKEARELGIYL